MTALWLGAVAAASGDWMEAEVITPLSQHELSELGRQLGFSVDHGERRIVAGPEALARLAARGVTVQRLARRAALPDGYLTPEQVGDRIRALAEDHPRAGYARIGTSVAGRSLDALWLGQPPGSGAAVVRVLGGHHGDEASSWEIAIATAEALAERDATDPAVTAALDAATIWFVPLVNPDGAVAATRFNARGVDLNRNYDYAWSSAEYGAGPAPFSEPESSAMRVLAVYGGFAWRSVTLHSGAANIGYPWNWTPEDSADEALFSEVANAYVAACATEGFWATNGADWYETHGDTNDWSYGRYGGLDFTVEGTVEKTPPSSEIDTFVAEHLEAMVGFVTARPSSSGAVVDASTGRGIGARLTWLRADGGRAAAGSWTDPLTGHFYRDVPPEAETLLVEAPGYVSADVPADEAVVSLQPKTLREGHIGPFVVAPGGWVALSDGSGTAHLSRPGYAPVEASVWRGLLELPSNLPEGPWTIETEGATWANGIFVQDDGNVELHAWTRIGDRVEVDGTGFAPGTRGFALWGPDRPLVPLATADESSTRVALTGAPSAGFDLVLVSDGEQRAIADLPAGEGSGEVAGPGAPITETPSSGCACNSSGAPLSIAIGAAALLMRTRRRT